ncbi:hypothetical protein [Roseateles koreensis]|uniref:Uncharacterized protein n=1 Tax=Roseateles koreensis TaxID=2987526 RepID=A0ABT5KPZ5_9BURK|nr:hypothetical protein [Roseateles koreensis]MDC8784989.1 hypothetical protein [Roseateles koreensis]
MKVLQTRGARDVNTCGGRIAWGATSKASRNAPKSAPESAPTRCDTQFVTPNVILIENHSHLQYKFKPWALCGFSKRGASCGEAHKNPKGFSPVGHRK